MKNQYLENKPNKQKLRSIVAITLASMLLLYTFIGRYFPSGGVLQRIANFFVGCFGMSFYGIMIAVILSGAFYLSGKRLVIPKKYIANFIVLYLLIVLVVHAVTTTFLTDKISSYSEYTAIIYNYYTLPTFGGVVFGSIAYMMTSTLRWGAYIVLFLLLLIPSYFTVVFLYEYATNKLILDRHVIESVNSIGDVDIGPSKVTQEVYPEIAKNPEYEKAYEVLFNEKPLEPSGSQSGSSTNRVNSKYQSANRSMLDDNVARSGNVNRPYQPNNVKQAFPSTQNSVDIDNFEVTDFFAGAAVNKPSEREEEVRPQDLIVNVTPEANNTISMPKQRVETPPQQQPDYTQRPQDFNPPPTKNVAAPPIKQAPVVDIFTQDQQNDIDIDDIYDEPPYEEEEPVMDEIPYDDEPVRVIPTVEPIGNGLGQDRLDFADSKDYEQKAGKVHQYLKYNLPPTELLSDEVLSAGISQEELRENCALIVNKLEVFGIRVEALPPIVGPSVTQYRLRPLSDKTRMGQFAQYAGDIKSCLEAVGDIRIEAPIPGTNLVGMEVANRVRRTVMMRAILESKEFKTQKGHLNFAIGQDINGRYVIGDLGKMPHLLVAGTTGSGKSVALNAMIVSMMYKYSPEYLRFIMIDPKYVELSKYNGSPHLLTNEAVTTVADSISSLDYLIKEMNVRYGLLRQNRVSHIDEYNAKINPKFEQKLPYIVLVVDELADIVLTAGKNFETKLAMIAQKSRAAGIHIVLATQRPSKEIVTGVIKANMPCKMALKVSSRVNSQIILDTTGAETLVGNGDMLYMDGASPEIRRIQGCYVSSSEISDIVEFCRQNNEIYYEEAIEQQIFASKNPASDENVEKNMADEDDDRKRFDPYCRRALYFWLTKRKGWASIASIQRQLNIGFNRAGRIVDSLVQEGYLEDLPDSDTSNKPRRVLISIDQLDKIFPDQQILPEDM
jgi:DNA segregation ATPase FtsK/SpoIIIE-like protein